MKYLKNFEMKYVSEENQYDSLDLTEEISVAAEYIRVEGCEGNPDIAALPKPLLGIKAIKRGTVVPPILLDDKADLSLKTYAIRNLRIPLAVQGRINSAIYEGMVMSYENRNYALTDNPITIVVDDENEKSVNVNILSSSYENCDSRSGGIIGQPGTGKSTALNVALSHIPKVIIHRFPGGYYTQIPVIRTTAFSRSNVSALFRSFADKLDFLLDTKHRHRDALKAVKGNVGSMTTVICDWISIYHIGCWVIEEVEFFTFSSSDQSSFENIVHIMNETGVFLMVTANPDLDKKLKANLRQTRRLEGDYID